MSSRLEFPFAFPATDQYTPFASARDYLHLFQGKVPGVLGGPGSSQRTQAARQVHALDSNRRRKLYENPEDDFRRGIEGTLKGPILSLIH